MSQLKHLFAPIKIGKLELRNRIVMPAMGTRLHSDTGAPSERTINYYAERARGGAALIIVEVTWVILPTGKFADVHLSVDSDRYITPLSDLTEAVHAYGAKIALQLHHGGRHTAGTDVFGPSDVPTSAGVVPRAMTLDEIETFIEAYAEGARRAKMAGFDAVELHGAHSYLVGQFLSPYTNRRTDRYGGSTENRTRFATDIIKRIRQKVGPDFPISFRMSGDEYTKGGLTLDETKVIAGIMDNAGVNILHVSAGTIEKLSWTVPPMARPNACNIHLAEAIKKVVRIPVIGVGAINDPLLAEEVLSSGKADLISMGRGLIADPELPGKAAAGRLQDIRPCIRCNRCLERAFLRRRIKCLANPQAGNEAQTRIFPALRPKKVVVVGGGPAGMEAAMVAASRGHQVTLLEQGTKLGGNLTLASIPPAKGEVGRLVKYLVGQMETPGITVEMGRKATPARIARLKPDAVIVAAGATPLIPEIPGIRQSHVIPATELLANSPKTGQQVVVIGGGMVGAESAEFLAEKGKTVTIVEMLPEVATDVEPLSRGILLERLAGKGVNLLVNTRALEIKASSVIITNRSLKTGQIPADTVVLATGFQPNRELLSALEGKVAELYSIGDCVEPRTALEAIHEGARTAREI